MVSLRINSRHFCGGCLTSWWHVLTAARCIHHILLYGGPKYDFANVLVGTVNLSLNGTEHAVEKMVHHNKYNNTDIFNTSDYDYGVILVR